MSVFRPTLRASTPNGNEWEVYAYRLQMPKRGATYDPGLAGDEPVGVYLPAEAELDALDAILWFFGLIPRLLVRVLWDFPRAGIAALGSDDWTVEAVSWYPQRTSHKWITKRSNRRQVVTEIGQQIAAGHMPPKPRDAVYAGEER